MSVDTGAYGQWSLLIRIGHWLMAGAFLVNYWWLEEGDDAHEWVGYGLLAVLTVRILYGFWGPLNARFRDFFPTPSRLKYAYIHFTALQREHQDQRRHNPIAGLMVMFLLSMMLVTGISGWMQELDAFWGEDWVQNLHAWSADAVMVAVVGHIAAVLVIQAKYKVPLIRHMLRG